VKKFLIAAVAALALATVATTASAQHRGGGGGGGGGGAWHGGSGGGGWHGGSGGGWHGGGWHGHDGHSHFVFSVGFPFYWPYYGYYPYGYYGYYPYAYGYPYYDGYYDSAPQTYIQRDDGATFAPAAPQQRSQYSYYCPDPAGYYPQINSCPSGWLTVVPNAAPHAAPAPH
jgi:hypothetical protein